MSAECGGRVRPMRWRSMAVCIVLIGAAGGALASDSRPSENYRWSHVKVGAGGFAPNIIYSRVERGLAYLRTDMGGAYRWDVTRNTWVALQDSMAESNYFGIESIAPDPKNADIVYLAAGMYRRDGAAILRSSNRGDAWEVFPVSFRMGGNEDGRGLGERLAIDPDNTGTLYFGSRHDGLQRSVDRGATWNVVESFPIKGRGVPPRGQPTNAGISFVLFVKQAILVAVADPSDRHLFRSDDAGKTWVAVAGEPRAELLPAKADADDSGVVYITYSNKIGPSGVTDGAVYKYDLTSGAWQDITPERGASRAPGGYMGVSAGRQHDRSLVVATMNRWKPGDTVWRSTDGGLTWRSLLERSKRVVTASPFLLWGKPEPDFGWWMAALAIDPFDSSKVAYATGATVYATSQLNLADRGEAIEWRPWVEGIEQTAVLALASPPEGPPLLSGFGDISGFAHEDLAVSPRAQFVSPLFANTNTIDFAGRAPNVVVRSGTTPHRGNANEAKLAYSIDHGLTWTALSTPEAIGDGAIATSADGLTFIAMTPTPSITKDRGKTWSQVEGLPNGARAVADRVEPRTFYAMDFAQSRVFVSTKGRLSFKSQITKGLPSDVRADQPTWREAAWPLSATPGRARDLWFISQGKLFHSTDGGRTFEPVANSLSVQVLSFGKAPAGRAYPALFAIAVDSYSGVRAIYRSDDVGVTWLRLNDERHEYGRRFRCISGDPRVFGRVYVGTDGRGILLGDLS